MMTMPTTMRTAAAERYRRSLRSRWRSWPPARTHASCRSGPVYRPKALTHPPADFVPNGGAGELRELRGEERIDGERHFHQPGPRLRVPAINLGVAGRP